MERITHEQPQPNIATFGPEHRSRPNIEFVGSLSQLLVVGVVITDFQLQGHRAFFTAVGAIVHDDFVELYRTTEINDDELIG